MDTLVIGENYSNHETLGKLTIRKTGEVLAGWKTEVGALDPWMTGEAEDGNFVYETRPLAGAEYTITAAEDIYTQDRQTDNYGNRTLWYAKGDVVAVVTTGNGSADIAAFAPARTKATYDFLSVIHDGTIGEVSVTLPLGSYHIEETKPPYGYVGTSDSYDVTFVWDAQLNDVVMATSMNNGGEAADQMVREALQVTEVAIKLSALGIKNALALSLAYAKENPKVKGKTSLDRLLREGKELKIIALQSKDVGQFKELAKQYGVLFAVIKDKAQNEKVDVMFKAEDVSKLNRIYEQLGYHF